MSGLTVVLRAAFSGVRVIDPIEIVEPGKGLK